MSKVTLKDIADDTGYSISTVSRVLNGSGKISHTTASEILESAEKHDYRSGRARHRGDRSSSGVMNVALVGTGFHEGEFYTSFFNGLNRAARRHNIRLFLTGVLDLKDDFSDIISEVASRYYDGIILYVPEFRRRNYEELKSMIPDRFPVVSNALIENPVFPTITFDSYSGGHIAAVHLQEKGHRSVGIIKGPVERAESRFRYNGFADYVNQQPGMQLSWTYEADFTFDSGHDAFEAFDRLTEKPSAIFATNDDMCNGFMEAGIAAGYRFPDDIAIMGYDDLPVCKHNRPTMSSIRTDYEQLGAATMKTLREDSVAHETKASLLSLVPVSVVEREST